MAELVALVDGEGSFTTLREAFGVSDGTPWRVLFCAFLARVGAATVVVDTGLGPSDLGFLPGWEGRLPQALAAAGVEPEQVDLVVLTHLHVDHVGWNMRDGVPFFPNAHYVAHRDDYEWITSVDGNEPYVRDNVVALHAAGRLELVGEGAEPLAGVRVLHTGGHTPGHCIVEIPDATLLGDLAVHELQLADPGLAYVRRGGSGRHRGMAAAAVPGLHSFGPARRFRASRAGAGRAGRRWIRLAPGGVDPRRLRLPFPSWIAATT